MTNRGAGANSLPSRGRSFCDSSNRLLGSLVDMFLRAKRWQVGACVFHIQPAKRTLRMSTFILPELCRKCPPPCATIWFGSQCLQSGAPAAPGLAIITSRGAISDRVGKNRAKQEIISDCLTSACQLQQLFQQPTSSKSTCN